MDRAHGPGRVESNQKRQRPWDPGASDCWARHCHSSHLLVENLGLHTDALYLPLSLKTESGRRKISDFL